MDELIEALRRLCAIEGRPLTVAERAESKIAMSQAADALEAAREDAAKCAAALPGPCYMDPPDGGDVPVHEQLRRMGEDAARHRHLRSNESSGHVDLCVVRVEWSKQGNVPTRYEVLTEERADQAIDQARGKGGCGEGVA